MTDLQSAGKIRYFGSLTFPAYRIVQAEWAARENYLSRYATEQPSYTAIPSNRARLDAVEQLAKVADGADLTMIQLALGFVTTHEKYDTPPALLDAAQRRRCAVSHPC